MCAHAVRVALKGIKGVENVEVSLNKGLATITLSDGNAVTMKQLRDAITKNGFTTKSSDVRVSGQLLEKSGPLILRIIGSDEEFSLVRNGTETVDRTLIGKNVTVEGTLPEVASGNAMPQLRFRSIRENK